MTIKRTRETETRSDARATAVALKVQPAHGRAVDRLIASRSGSLGKFPQNLRTTINHFLASIRGNADKAKRIHIRATQTRIIKKTKIDSQDSIEFRHFPAVWTRDVETRPSNDGTQFIIEKIAHAAEHAARLSGGPELNNSVPSTESSNQRIEDSNPSAESRHTRAEALSRASETTFLVRPDGRPRAYYYHH